MAAVDYRVISIGTLAAHPLWQERGEVRTGHATTTLVTAGAARIVVDPSLPHAALLARFGERTNLRREEVTHVFLTSADSLHRRAIELFDDARWLVNEPELDAVRAAVSEDLAAAREGDDAELVAALQREVATLERCAPAPDVITAGVDLFPLPGVTPGCCGLLLPLPRSTVVICGDAVPTVEHLDEGKVLPGCFDVDLARESLAEAVQIADTLVPGRDNVVINPLRPAFGP